MKLICNIRKDFGSFVLKTSLETEDMFSGLLGESGCGKSMTLKCIAGIVTPDEGLIQLGDRVLFDSRKHINVKPQDRKVGYLFQNYALFPTMTIRKNIYCGMHSLHDKAEKERKYQETMKLLHLEGLDDHKPSQLSGGQAQRVALARMIVGDPELLLLDEPFSALDTHLKEKLQGDMKELIRNLGKMAVLVTHSQTEAYRLCSSISVMQKGEIIRSGRTEEVFQDPQFVACAHLFGHRNFSRFTKTGEKTIRLEPSGIVLNSIHPVPDGCSILSITNEAIRHGLQIPVKLVDIMKEQDGNMLILDYGSTKNLWWKVDKETTEVSSLSIDLDHCVFLKER